jgi:hypothetical protein
MSTIFRGDVIVGALGRRRALRGFSGDVPATLKVGDVVEILNRGGVVGSSQSVHKDFGKPVSCEVLGMPVRAGKIVNLADASLPAVSTLEGLDLPPIVVVSGTCMECGKTLFLTELTQELTRKGIAVAGGKLTGIACLRDLNALEDHGAKATASFLDLGYPSTAGVGPEALVAVARAIVAYLAKPGVDVILLEMGDGIIGEYGVLRILEDPEIRRRIRFHAFCAADMVGAWGGHAYLSRHDIPIDLFSGPVTDNEVGVRYIEGEFGRPAINAHKSPELIAGVVAEKLGLAGSPAPGGAASTGKRAAAESRREDRSKAESRREDAARNSGERT